MLYEKLIFFFCVFCVCVCLSKCAPNIPTYKKCPSMERKSFLSHIFIQIYIYLNGLWQYGVCTGTGQQNRQKKYEVDIVYGLVNKKNFWYYILLHMSCDLEWSYTTAGSNTAWNTEPIFITLYVICTIIFIFNLIYFTKKIAFFNKKPFSLLTDLILGRNNSEYVFLFQENYHGNIKLISKLSNYCFSHYCCYYYYFWCVWHEATLSM